MTVQKYVITGGPCSGKTSLINELRDRGFETLTESAAEVIENYQINHKDIRDKLGEIQRNIFKLQIQKEKELESGEGGVVFLDRGLIDGLAYVKMRGSNCPNEVIECCKESDYAGVFFCELMPEFEGINRLERTRHEAERIETGIKEVYNLFEFREGLNMWHLPSSLSIEERADIVIDTLREQIDGPRNGYKH